MIILVALTKLSEPAMTGCNKFTGSGPYNISIFNFEKFKFSKSLIIIY